MTEGNKYLAVELFNPAVITVAINSALRAIVEALNNPGDRQVLNEFESAPDAATNAVTAAVLGPSRRLTDDENDLYIKLKRKKLRETSSGCFLRMKLSDDEERVYDELEAKADGR